jgi:hypothetical protein
MSAISDFLGAYRGRGSDRNGGSFSPLMIDLVWRKAMAVAGMDPAEWRKDAAGAWMQRSQYGRTTEMGNGWEIDHIVPVAHGGDDGLGNLQALQWQNNRGKGDTYPYYGPWDVVAKA